MLDRQAAMHERRASFEPIHDLDPRSGTTIEVFYVGSGLANSAGLRRSGWFYSRGREGSLRRDPPIGPFTTAYSAYRAALGTG
jgi:hypothetical protein